MRDFRKLFLDMKVDMKNHKLLCTLIFAVLCLILAPVFIPSKTTLKMKHRFQENDAYFREVRDNMARMPKRFIGEELPVQKFTKDHGVYVGITTSPSRLNQLKYALWTLDYSYVEKVLLCIPTKFGRTGETFEIPNDFLLEIPAQVVVLTSDVDYGPVTRAILAKEYLNKVDPGALLILVDDDTAYPIGMVNEYIHMVAHHPEKAFTSAGWLMKDYFKNAPKGDWFKYENSWPVELSRNEQVHVGECFSGFAFLIAHVDVKCLKRFNGDAFCKFSDDVVLSYCLAKNGVTVEKVHSPFLQLDWVLQYQYGFKEDALHQGAGIRNVLREEASLLDKNGIKYLQCLSAIAR